MLRRLHFRECQNKPFKSVLIRLCSTAYIGVLLVGLWRTACASQLTGALAVTDA